MKREAKHLYARAIDSLVLGVDHFNCSWDRGRAEAVLIFLDRAFELIMKAIIVERGGNIRDKGDRALTIGYESCIRICLSNAGVKCLSKEDAINFGALPIMDRHILDEQWVVPRGMETCLNGQFTRLAPMP